MNEHIIPLSDTRRCVKALGGSKSAALAKILHAGIPVPRGFCIGAAGAEEAQLCLPRAGRGGITIFCPFYLTVRLYVTSFFHARYSAALPATYN